jgi:hypothetical protein
VTSLSDLASFEGESGGDGIEESWLIHPLWFGADKLVLSYDFFEDVNPTAFSIYCDPRNCTLVPAALEAARRFYQHP